MNDPFKSENYKKNLDSLIEAIKLKNIGEQYNKTVRDLSQTLESFTDKAEDVAKFVICSDLNNFIEPVNKKPSGFFGIFKEIFNKILGKDASIQDNDIRNFANDKLPSLAEKITFEYLNVLKKISDLEQSKKNQEEHRLYGVNLEDRTASKQEENPLYELQAGDSGYGSSLNEEHEYEDISNYQEKKSKILIENSQSSKSPKEEPIYATVSKEHIEAKRKRKQKQQPQSLVLPKPPRASQVPKKMFTTGQEVRQESKVVVKDKPAVPPKPKNLSRADQKVSTEPKVVEVILKKSAESKPIVPLKSENQDNRKSAQKAAGKMIPKVAAATMKGGANREMGSKVKALKEKFEQNQAKGNANVRLAESKTTPAAQADIGVKKKQSHSFLTENKRSATKHITAKSDPKSHVSKNPPSTQVSVKEMVAQIEKGKGGR
ncbi:MAG: hypothetical protein O7167_00875 [Wolbachia endosymbiont of Andrena nigroaenea]|uniref:hypothetical protein n=1 Tax=Wolbachia endosymbiont (group A) of Andrena hattorfiana TaxID=2953977 RepID=UPI0021F8C5BB|nr:hypothetical protein [Wolbachia endosymbiont (group A) of Andrena hattorfiana]MDX5526434.1 hypothetical protein [Wolbachia endosymbiont of Andrena nigroaenea]